MRPPIALHTGLFVPAALGLVLLAGCQAAQRHAATQPAVPRAGNAELVAYISDQPYVTAEAAYRAVYILSKKTAFDGDFAALASAMQSDGLVARQWQYAPERTLDRGAVGFMFCRACQIRSGVNWMLTGLGRYAWRELQFQRIAGGGGEYGLMSGGEFVGLLSRAEEYLRRTGKTETPPAELGSPTDERGAALERGSGAPEPARKRG